MTVSKKVKVCCVRLGHSDVGEKRELVKLAARTGAGRYELLEARPLPLYVPVQQRQQLILGRLDALEPVARARVLHGGANDRNTRGFNGPLVTE